MPSLSLSYGRADHDLPLAPSRWVGKDIAQKPPFRAVASTLGRKQKLLTGRRADHQIKSGIPRTIYGWRPAPQAVTQSLQDPARYTL